MTLLIVEDVAFMRNNIKSILKNESLKIIEADRVETAIPILQEYNIDIMILDLNLNPIALDSGEKSGLRVLEYIKENNLKVPYTIILSGTINHDNIKKACQLGVDKFLSKPCKSKDILDSVQEAKMHTLRNLNEIY